MQTVTARVKCDHVDTNEFNQTVYFSATKKTDSDNSDFTKFTPGGKAEFMITSEAPAFNKFIPGKHYQVEFTELE